jgi:hypothetical protein
MSVEQPTATFPLRSAPLLEEERNAALGAIVAQSALKPAA